MKKMKKIIIALVLAAFILTIGCGGMGIEGNFEMNRDELQALFDEEAEFILLDVREPYEFDEGNIDYSFNMPLGVVESSVENQSYWDSQAWDMPGKDDLLIIYSMKGKRGALAVERLIKLGYTNVVNLYGGYTLWLDPDADLDAEPVSGGCGG